MPDIKDTKYDLGLDLTVDDQKKIGKFTNLHYNQYVYEQKIKAMKEKLTNIESSIDEVSLLFDAKDVMLNIGDCFFRFDTDQVEDNLTEFKNDEKKNLNKLEAEYNDILSTKERLKTELYSKFGNRIDLN